MPGLKGVRKFWWITFFLAPSLLGLALFTLLPIVASAGLTVFEWDLLTPPRFVGLENFVNLASDQNFRQAFWHTLQYIIGYIPTVMVLALAVALMLKQTSRWSVLLRIGFFMPVVSAWVAVALIWKWLLNPRFGLFNYLLSLLGIVGPNWLFDPKWAMPAIIMTSVWKDIGFVMVMFLAGLQSIPHEYYEAADLDGASSWQRLRYITLPLLSPTTFFVIIMLLINSFQVFDQVWIMTEGGPAGATMVLVEQIVKNTFSYSRMGYASAMSWVLFAMVFVVTVIQNRFQQNWVTYD